MEYKEPKIAYSKAKDNSFKTQIARLPNGGMCIIEKNWETGKRAKYKWRAVMCEPNVFEITNCEDVKETYVLGYNQVKGWEGEPEYGKTRKEAVLSCLIKYWE